MLMISKGALAAMTALALAAGTAGSMLGRHKTAPDPLRKMGLECPDSEAARALEFTQSITLREELAGHYVRVGACSRLPGVPTSPD
ncbi:MAG TPA: hypothetical protein VHC68_01895 [Candidatus Paceibacterota bacterium]|nr:hypothetical protein [Candidatus Paceibacterota bacterium]